MIVGGFEFGNQNCVVTVARQGGIRVVPNHESNQETPLVGPVATASFLKDSNQTNAISHIKSLIGRHFSDPHLQRDLESVPFSVTEGPDGYPLVHAWHLGECKSYTPAQLLGIQFSNLKRIGEKKLTAPLVDCCIGIPVYFTDIQRRAVTIAGLNPLRLMHETDATALAYGFWKTDLPENELINVAFIHAGQTSLQVCIAAFKKGQLKILAHTFDRSLGGRDFDQALYQYFAAKFKDEYMIDVYQSAAACKSLREILKKMLSANNPEVEIGYIKREEFEQVCTSILEPVKKPLEKALADAGLTIQNIHSFEIVGSRSQVPAMVKILTDFFGMEPSRTMNAKACVALGCALQCTILSPSFKVREFQVNESFPFPISLTWKTPDGDTQNRAGGDNLQTTVVFPKGSPIPSMKALTFYMSETFALDVQYADVSELQAPAKISRYTIGPFQSTNGQKAKLEVTVCLNLHGIVSVESATLLEEDEEEVDVAVVKESDEEPAKMETNELLADPVPPSTADVNMQDSETGAPAADNGIPDSGDNPVQMETDVEVDAPKKKVNKKTVPVSEVVFGALAAPDVQKAVEELEMALQDRSMKESKDKKNDVESYVYDMRNKLDDKYYYVVTDSEREQLITGLQEVEDWLYGDGKDETKCVYAAMLEELKQQGDALEERYKEHTERGYGIDRMICQAVNFINYYKDAAMSTDTMFDHIDVAEKQKVLNECVEAEACLREKVQDIIKKCEALDRFCRPIMTKPIPTPAKPATPELASPGPFQGSESQPQGANNADSSPSQNTGAGVGQEVPAAAAAEPMGTDKSEGSQNL
ncbi:heat shock 70 kDa protein 15-like [Salvia hispanica]|uniref:heat shock 70 kDa protein 15-like n=1 Tax=Salvia hispanica TaxID=49212 RepID=UPI0020090A2C|nr:heat shock 70 kDa protein 15-like [Salvia hispanica]XP_047973316.1 heat shock 70 kDa protein 15-like [Salvia hispanica]